MSRERVGYALKLLVSVGILLLLASRVDMGAALGHLAAVEPWHAAAAAALFVATHAVNALKLGVLLPEYSTASLLAYTLATQAYALLLPGQIAGEAVKAYRLSRRAGAGAGRIVSAVVFDKLTAIATILLLTLGGLLAEHRRFGDGMIWLAGAALAGLLAAAAVLAWERTRRWSLSLGGRGEERRQWAAARLAHFLDTWRAHAAHPGTVALSLGYGLLSQGLAIAGSLVFAQGLGIDLGYAVWCVIIGALSVLLLAPITIGGIGLREVSLVGLLVPFGVAPDQAMALALAIFAFQILVAATGLIVDLLVLKEA